MKEIEINYIVKRYYEDKKSTYEISQELGTYPNKIRRLLNKHGYDLRDKNEAQTVALKSGRSSHPTEGTQRTEEERVKISSSLAENWAEMPQDELERRKKYAKKRWDTMEPEKLAYMRKAAAFGLRSAARHGSKMEHFIVDKLKSSGYNVILHDKDLLEGRLECDIHLPDKRIVIEIDGPKHREPWFGEEQLKEQIERDKRKDSLLMSMDYILIRVELESKAFSTYRGRKNSENILNLLSSGELEPRNIYYL